MVFHPLALVLCVLMATPVAVAAQSRASYVPVFDVAQAAPTGAVHARSQLSLEAGYVSAGLSLARRIGSGPLSVGAGVWGSWEPPSSFEKNVWEPMGVTLFGRYAPVPWLHADLGATAARYLWTDDCSECTGTFVGLRSSLMVGYRGFVFVGPDLALGRASDDRFGAEWGALLGAQLRLVLGWGG
jgi:hypothetical protein